MIIKLNLQDPEIKKLLLYVEEFNLSNVAMLMNLAMQFGIDIQNFNNEMK